MSAVERATRFGTELNAEDQQHVLRAYVHRYTGDHIPGWARQKNGTLWPVQFASDAEWLAHTRFTVRKDGRLNMSTKYCRSFPTWPNGRGVRTFNKHEDTGGGRA